MQVSIFAVEKTLVTVARAVSVSLPGESGQFCVYPHHISFVSLLRSGSILVKYKENNTEQSKEVSIKNGIFSIKNDKAIALVQI